MLGNRLIGNDDDCAGLEITINGPSLRFHVAAQVVVAGADIGIDLDGESQAMWTVISIAAGQTLALGSIPKIGARAYLLIRGGLQCPEYLGSRATFTLGQFGGHAGRALRMGDVLKICPLVRTLPPLSLPIEQRPKICNRWELHVTYGPHGAPDFFTQNDIERLFDSEWEVHFNSSRTGIRLIGPKPEWARETGGEAGMHPSNIHDNAYAFGTVDFTGDMPVILGPDGPSLGGFVCPATVISADLWKLGQLRAGDKLRFVPVAMTDAQEAGLRAHAGERTESLSRVEALTCILRDFKLSDGLSISVRAAGDRFVLVEFGDQVLDLELRFQVAALHQMMEAHRSREAGGLRDLTPGIRSLQIHYDPERLPLNELLTLVEQACNRLEALDDVRVPSRIVHLPLSWNDEACHEAVRKYTQSVRADAPWCPDNIEFIRRINGLESVQAVRDIVFSAEYVVMGLGDVYLGAPVATPVDPRLRLVTTKYNPARTWTAENSVGIGGAYLCVYGMEGPGGYQFVGRTLQMWNRYRQTEVFEKPWLLRFFDRIRFYPVSHEELTNIRRDFPRGRYPLRIEEGEFSLAEHRQFMQANADSIGVFQQKRQQAFDAELQRWRDRGQLRFDASHQAGSEQLDDAVPEGCIAVQSHAAGNIWKVLVEPGQDVKAGDTLMILESMKMEIGIDSPATGKVHAVLKSENSQVASGQALMIIEPA